jgi:hypothetical protein
MAVRNTDSFLPLFFAPFLSNHLFEVIERLAVLTDQVNKGRERMFSELP